MNPKQPESGGNEFIDVENLLRMALRQTKVVAVSAVIALLLGIVYLQTTPPTYVATSRILVDENLSKVIDEVSPIASSMQTEAAMLSQIEVLRSARLAAVVADKLNLHRNEDFMSPPTSLVQRTIGQVRMSLSYMLSLVRPADPATQARRQEFEELDEATRDALMSSSRRRAAVGRLQANLLAQRVGRSLVIVIGFQSHDPNLAAAITRAYAEAYLGDQLNASFEATEQAAVWLEGRLTELRESSQAAALEVERFRAENGLAETQGQLVSEQQLSELSAQLISAQADAARALARFEQFEAMTSAASSPDISQMVAPVGVEVGPAFGELRTRHQNLSRRKADIEANFGAEHPQAVALGREIAQITRLMVEEIAQITESYRNEYQVALARERTLRQSVADATGRSAQANQSQVRLRELEQQATALRALYQSFLDRYEQTTQQQTFPVAKVRVISEATPPGGASSPRSIMVLGLSLVLGLMMGGALGALNEFNERFFRVGKDVSEGLGFRFLGYLPLLSAHGAKHGRKRGKDGRTYLAGDEPLALAATDHRRRMRVSVDAPLSMFAETFRSAKIACDVVLQANSSKVIGMISVLPGEGKSTVAANLAELLAASGARTLLIDGDLRNPGLTRHLGIQVQTGVIDAVVNPDNWRSAIKYNRQTGLAILPGLVRGRFSHTSEALSSAGMRRLIEDARTSFDYVIVDLPPVGPVVDAKAFSPLVDGFIAVVEWGKTPRAIVHSAIRNEPLIASKVLGVVLNKVRLDRLPRYGSFGGSEQFIKRYSSYYLDDPEQQASSGKGEARAKTETERA